MQKEDLESKVEEGWSTYKLAEHFVLSPGSIRYWLKKFDLKTKNQSFGLGYSPPGAGGVGPKSNDPNEKWCPQCASFLPLTDFYIRKDKNRKTDSEPTGWCKKCCCQTSHMRQKENKQMGIEYKGGKCCICGYNKYHGALEFHHLSPEHKDPKFARLKTAAWETLRKEIDKCVLLCSNCHREVHAKVASIPE